MYFTKKFHQIVKMRLRISILSNRFLSKYKSDAVPDKRQQSDDEKAAKTCNYPGNGPGRKARPRHCHPGRRAEPEVERSVI